jgi:hypothetical protein
MLILQWLKLPKIKMLLKVGERHMNASSGINKGFGKEAGSIFLSPKRITVTVSAMTVKKLWKRSLEEGRSLSNLAAFLLEQATASDSQD